LLNKERLKHYLDKSRRVHFQILFGVTTLMGVLGLLFFKNIFFAILFTLLPILFAATIRLKKSDALSKFEATPLEEFRYPQVFEIVRDLSLKSKIGYVPELFFIPSKIPNALAVGESENAGVGISSGLIDNLTLEELRGVLAHEISHIKNQDHKILKITHMAYSLSSFISFFINIVILFSLPLILTGRVHVSSISVLILLISPNLLQLMILGLMRNRELTADLTAVSMTGDPESLASALIKINDFTSGRFSKFLIHKMHNRDHWLDTHPSPMRRVRRLKRLASFN
jgi:heat shock protein HtpX